MLNESEVGGVARGALAEVKRWSLGRKKRVVLRLAWRRVGRCAVAGAGRDRCRTQGARARSGRGAQPDVGRRRHPHPDRRGRLGVGARRSITSTLGFVGIHAAKIGNRFAALQPIAQGLKAESGATGTSVGKGRTLRMESGRNRVQESLQSSLASRKTGFPVTPRSPAVSCHPEGRMNCKSVSNPLRAVQLYAHSARLSEEGQMQVADSVISPKNPTISPSQ